jgi:hypothetical protein
MMEVATKVQSQFRLPDSNAGEGGKVILYSLLEGHLGAPTVLSKMELKVTRRVSVSKIQIPPQHAHPNDAALRWNETPRCFGSRRGLALRAPVRGHPDDAARRCAPGGTRTPVAPRFARPSKGTRRDGHDARRWTGRQVYSWRRVHLLAS